MTRARVWTTIAALALALVAPGASAQVAMPDARQMSGVPLPAGDLANGTVTVRVVRERMGNNVPNQEVTLATPDGNVSACDNTNDDPDTEPGPDRQRARMHRDRHPGPREDRHPGHPSRGREPRLGPGR